PAIAGMSARSSERISLIFTRFRPQKDNHTKYKLSIGPATSSYESSTLSRAKYSICAKRDLTL
ncbi:hypothetical protein, partial [Ensifer sp. 22460]